MANSGDGDDKPRATRRTLKTSFRQWVRDRCGGDRVLARRWVRSLRDTHPDPALRREHVVSLREDTIIQRGDKAQSADCYRAQTAALHAAPPASPTFFAWLERRFPVPPGADEQARGRVMGRRDKMLEAYQASAYFGRECYLPHEPIRECPGHRLMIFLMVRDSVATGTCVRGLDVPPPPAVEARKGELLARFAAEALDGRRDPSDDVVFIENEIRRMHLDDENATRAEAAVGSNSVAADRDAVAHTAPAMNTEVFSDADLHRRCRNCQETRLGLGRDELGNPIREGPCPQYEPHEHWDCLICHGRGTVPVFREGETRALKDIERTACTNYMHPPRAVVLSGDYPAAQRFHDNLEALFPSPAQAWLRARFHRWLLVLLDHKEMPAHEWLCHWGDDVAEKLGLSEIEREPLRTRRYRESWPDGADAASRAVILRLLAGDPLPKTWQQAHDMIECERRRQLSNSVTVTELTAAPKEPAWNRMKVSDDDERVTLDGVEHRLNGSAAGPFLRALIDAKGGLVAAKTLEDVARRPDRITRSLPSAVRAFVERPGRGHAGYRLVNPPLTTDVRSTP